MTKILATAQQRGSVNALKKPIELLIREGHEVSVYATGNQVEAAGFGDLNYTKISPKDNHAYTDILGGNQLLLTGLSGVNTSDFYFIKAANELNIKSIAVNDQNLGYRGRFQGIESLPTILVVMTEGCGSTLEQELGPGLSQPLLKNLKVVGWTAFDDYASIRDNFSHKKRDELLRKLKISPSRKIFFHATQNVWIENNPNFLSYERKVTEEVFQQSNNLRISLVVKPHPKEAKNPLLDRDITKDLAKKYGHTYLIPDSCNTKDLIISSNSVTAGKSTCLTEACLLDINTGGILPNCFDKEIEAFPPIAVNAIPYTQYWDGIDKILKEVIFLKDSNHLKDMRRKFSVDGKASQRLVEIVKTIL